LTRDGAELIHCQGNILLAPVPLLRRLLLLPGEARGLKMKTRFSGTEIFRKYLWYLLRERSFDNDAVADMQQLKSALGLTDDEVRT
jgi:hypothetical protein